MASRTATIGLPSDRTAIEGAAGVQASVGVDGKFLVADGEVFRVRGVTYGSFGPRSDGEPYPEADVVARDLGAMAAAGLNTLRTYSLPPTDVLDLAAETGLRVLVGLHYDDWRAERNPGLRARRRILEAGRRAVDEALERCAERPEVLALAVGNEVPGDLVRLHGIHSVEDTLSTLIAEIHAGSAGLLATYVNYPTTEYLRVDGQDLVCFNVFLEDPDDFCAYLHHLQIVSAERPLLISELGLAEGVHGQAKQADCLAWQLRLLEEAGCAGGAIFSWTDEWEVGGAAVEGWGFGLTDRERNPKLALDVVRAWAATSVADLRSDWPRISAVVCAHNEEKLITRCLTSLERCEYPNLEVIVCDDASTDRTSELAAPFPVRLLRLQPGGLSRARNAGIEAATGEIVAFLDADAEAHPEWPFHLALSLEDENVAATGGPNLSPPEAPFYERAVALSPGAPIHVLVSDNRAEHVPGCNMAFHKDALEEIGGFDPIYTAAGDDVDVCWKLLDRGYEIGFAAAAQVRHHRPATIRAYLRQQRNYGRAERMLSGGHRSRFNRLGQARWTGFIYLSSRVFPTLLRPIVYHGPMGLAPFQPVTSHRSEVLAGRAGPLLPFLLPFALLGFAGFMSLWWLLAPALVVTLLLAYGAAVAHGVRPGRQETRPVALRFLVALLHVTQPMTRMWGRLRGRPAAVQAAPASAWTGDRVAWLVKLLRELEARPCRVRTGNAQSDWDLTVSIGLLVSCRVTTAIAWNWSPRARVSVRPRPPALLILAAALAIGLAGFEWGLVAIGAGVAAAAVEWTLLRSLVRRALRATTAGA